MRTGSGPGRSSSKAAESLLQYTMLVSRDVPVTKIASRGILVQNKSFSTDILARNMQLAGISQYKMLSQ